MEHIDYVIGMSQEILDAAAIAFATGFYGAMGYGRSIEESYKFGCNQIHLTHSGFTNTARRSAVSEQQRKAEEIEVVGQSVNQISIPEHLKPQLKRKPKLATVANPGGRSSQELSSNEQVELQLTIDRTYDREIGAKQFREQVREYLQDHKLADHEKDLLDTAREELGLSAAEADRIIQEEQEPFLQAQQAYKKRLETRVNASKRAGKRV